MIARKVSPPRANLVEIQLAVPRIPQVTLHGIHSRTDLHDRLRMAPDLENSRLDPESFDRLEEPGVVREHDHLSGPSDVLQDARQSVDFLRIHLIAPVISSSPSIPFSSSYNELGRSSRAPNSE